MFGQGKCHLDWRLRRGCCPWQREEKIGLEPTGGRKFATGLEKGWRLIGYLHFLSDGGEGVEKTGKSGDEASIRKKQSGCEVDYV